MSYAGRSRLRGRLRALRDQVRDHGLRAGARYLLERARGYTAYRWHLFNEWRADRSFGIETRRTIGLDGLELSSARHADSVLYQATPYPAIRKAIASLPPVPLGGYTFVDLGCGKGRALVVAGAAGFGRVVGVELDAGLAAKARDNLSRAARRGSLRSSTEVLMIDAANLVPPEGPLVVYLHNPFGEETLRDVVSALDASWREQPRPILAVYYNPVHDALFDPTSWEAVARHPSDGFNIYAHRSGAVPSAPEAVPTA
jgi:SAM-dependent methyltransferase